MLILSLILLRFAHCEAFSLRAGTQSTELDAAHGSSLILGPVRDVFLFAGQSNCLGMGFQKDLPAKFAGMPRSLQVWKADHWNNENWDWTSLPGQFGPEVTFSHALDEIYGPRRESFGIVKVSKIMTSLYNDWALSNYKKLVGTRKLEELRRSTMRWDPHSNNTNFEPWLFANLIDTAQKALGSGVCAGKCQVKALIWVQGESDAMNAEYADVYEASLAKMVGILREELQAPDMKVVVAGVAPDLKDQVSFPATEKMLEAQQAFVEKERPATATLVSAANLDKMADKLHYDSAGQLDLGKRLADAYLSMGDQAPGQP